MKKRPFFVGAFAATFVLIFFVLPATLQASEPSEMPENPESKVSESDETSKPINESASNLLADPDFQTFGKTDSVWRNYGDGYEFLPEADSAGRRVARLVSEKPEDARGLMQVVEFNPPTTTPMKFGAVGRCLASKPDGTVSVYLDVHYADGTNLWGRQAHFAREIGDWTPVEAVFKPQRPVRSIEFFILIRGTVGTFDVVAPFLKTLPPTFDSVRAVGGLFGDGSVAVRTVSWSNRAGFRTKIAVRQTETTGEKTIERSFQRVDSAPLTTETIAASSRDSNQPNDSIKPDVPTKPNDATGETSTQGRCEATAAILGSNDETLYSETLDVDWQGNDAGRGYAVWTEPATKRVFLHSLPEAADAASLRERLERPSASIELARNEYESFQIAVLSPKSLENVAIEFSDLVDSNDSNQTIGADRLDWKQVGYLRADRLVEHPLEPEGVPGWFPDALLPVAFGTAPADRTVSFWVTVYATKETKPGVYLGTATLRPKNAPPAVVSLSVRVRDFELPDEGGLATAFALMDGFLERVYNRPTNNRSENNSPTTPELRRRYGEFLLPFRVGPEGDISRTEPPRLDDLLAYRGRGLGRFNLLNMVEPRGDAPWRCNSPPEQYTPAFKAETIERLAPLVERLRENDLVDRAYIYTFDESRPDFHPIMTDFFGAIKEKFPDVATFTTAYIGTDLELLNRLNVDWTCPLTSVYRFDEAERCRAAGKQVWSYICCGPTDPYANIMFRNPLIEARILGWQAFEQKYDGLLYWGLNIWDRPRNVPIDPDATIFLDWDAESVIDHPIYGDGRLIYAGKDGRPIGSVRLAAFRDGLEDYLYLELLAEKLGDRDAARRETAPVFESPIRFTHSSDVLFQRRRAVADRLESNNFESDAKKTVVP